MIFLRNSYIDKIKKYLPNKNAIILVGARQVWKSSLIRSLLEEKIIENEILLNWDDFILEDFSAKSFLEFLEFKYDIKNKDYLIIDEAQKINNIGIIIKYLVDKNKESDLNLKIIISWSWSLEIFRWITDSLVWRYNLIKVKPFSFSEFLEFNNLNISSINIENTNSLIKTEIDKYFDIYIKYWWYPEVIKAKTENDKKIVFKAIYDDYLYKDIWFLLREDENIYFIKFLKLFVTKIWSLVKSEQIIEELWIKKKLYNKFIQIVESSFLFDFISPFSSNIWNEIKKSTKWYMNDIGFLNYLLWIGQVSKEFKWKIIENYIYNELCFVKHDFEEIKFWQNKNGTEVDFLLIDNFDKRIFPIEVKSWKKDILPKSLLSFNSKYKENISNSIITTDWLNKKREIECIIYIFVDYRLISSYFLKNT